MIILKTEEEIEHMREGGAMLRTTLQEAISTVIPGVTTKSIDTKIEKTIISLGGKPGFKLVPGYKWASCISVNDEIVHTPPSERMIQDGDVVTIDAGVYLHGLHTDSAMTIQVGKQSPDVTKFLETGKIALKKALKQARVGKRLGHIAEAFQSTIENDGYSIVRELTGHGVGKDLHEDPYVPCFLDGPVEQTLKIKPGMTLALEVMYAMGDRHIKHEKNGWTISMADKSIAASFEHTIAILKNSTIILT